MPGKKHTPEEMGAKLRLVEALQSQGKSVAAACKVVRLPPPRGLTPRSLLVWWHPLQDVAPYQRQKRLSQSRSELDPEGRPLRHEECPGPEAKKHDLDRNALLPAHTLVTFLLGWPRPAPA